MYSIEEDFCFGFDQGYEVCPGFRSILRKRLILSDTIEDAEYEVITQS